jgi:Ca2+-binding RTX toxin-like protein
VTTQLNSNQALLLERDDSDAITSLIEAAGDTNGDGFDDILVGTFVPGQSQQLYHVQGADFRDEIDHLGTAGADSLVGSALADRIVAAQGNDTVFGGGGADVINAGQGNDELHVGDNKFFRIDGGAGTDTLHFDYAGAIDFANLDGDKATSDRGRISNMEVLDVANGFANAMTLHLADVLDLDVTIANVGGKASLDNVLRIDGEVGDTLHMFKADGWSSANTTALAGYAIYSYQAVKVAVDTDISVSVS